MPHLNPCARIPVCGLIAQYNATALPEGPNKPGLWMRQILRKRITLHGFIVFGDFGALHPEFARQMAEWVKSGQVRYREDLIHGLEQAPEAFTGLLTGHAFGKRVIKLSD